MNSEREGEGGKIWENGIETCKISCMKRVASQKKKRKKIPWTEETRGLSFKGLQRIRHDWVTEHNSFWNTELIHAWVTLNYPINDPIVNHMIPTLIHEV